MVVYSSVLFVSLMHCVQTAQFKDSLHGDMGDLLRECEGTGFASVQWCHMCAWLCHCH